MPTQKGPGWLLGYGSGQFPEAFLLKSAGTPSSTFALVPQQHVTPNWPKSESLIHKVLRPEVNGLVDFLGAGT